MSITLVPVGLVSLCVYVCVCVCKVVWYSSESRIKDLDDHRPKPPEYFLGPPRSGPHSNRHELSSVHK